MKNIEYICIYPNIEIPVKEYCKKAGKKFKCDHLEESDYIARCNIFYENLKLIESEKGRSVEKCKECADLSNKRENGS